MLTMSSVGIPRAQGREQRQDLQWLRSITRRYNEQIGVQHSRTNFSREAKNPETPFRTALKEDLLIGNWVLGSKRTEILYKGYGRSKSGQKTNFRPMGAL
jgi:hypothetical protein